MKKMIFHIPLKLDSKRKSASQIRPQKMLEAFRNVGYDVDVVEGSAKERKKAIDKIRQNIKDGVKYDFVYSESSTMPTLLTESHHYPLHPFLDYGLFKFCKEHNISIGLFYRDIYWCFPDYATNWKSRIGKIFYKYDILKYNQLVDCLFVPSKEMVSYIPLDLKMNIVELPSGCKISPIAEDTHNVNDSISLFYVGGIGHHYDLSMIVEILSEFPHIHLTICCRKDDWESVKSDYVDILPKNVEIIHKSDEGLTEYFSKSDLGILFVKPSIYWAFAMPYKLMEFIGNGLPVLASEKTKSAQFVLENNCGFVVEYSKESLRKFFKSISKDELNEMKAKIQNFAVTQTWEERAKTVIRYLKQ